MWGRFRSSKYQKLGAISQKPEKRVPFSVKWATVRPWPVVPGQKFSGSEIKPFQLELELDLGALLVPGTVALYWHVPRP